MRRSFFMQKRRKNQHKQKEPHLLKSLLFGGGVNLVFTAICLLIATKIAISTKDPSKTVLPTALVSLVLCSLSSGYITAKFYRRQGASVGALAGLLYCLVLVLLSFIIPAESTGMWWVRWVAYPAILLLATAGGMMGKSKTSRHRA